MRDPVKQSGGHFAITENLRLFTESQVGGNNQRCPFVELRDQVKQKLTTTF